MCWLLVICVFCAFKEHLDALIVLEKAAQATIVRGAMFEISLKDAGGTTSAASQFAGAVVKLATSLNLLGRGCRV